MLIVVFSDEVIGSWFYFVISKPSQLGRGESVPSLPAAADSSFVALLYPSWGNNGHPIFY